MATTTNYGWDTPDDTDLVKDGAAAIRTLGSSVDTTTKALNPSTTLGDVEYRSATANTNTRLGIGTTGQVLTVTGGVPAWQTISAGGMTLISTTTLTGASVVLSSIPSTYKNLQLVVRNLKPATDGDNFRIRLNGDGATRYNNYGWDAASALEDSFSASSINGAQTNMDNSVSNNIMLCNIWDYANAVTWKMGSLQGASESAGNPGNMVRNTNNFYYNQTAAISSITLFLDSGNFTSGTALLYGVS